MTPADHDRPGGDRGRGGPPDAADRGQPAAGGRCAGAAGRDRPGCTGFLALEMSRSAAVLDDVLRRDMWMDPDAFTVEVRDGVVTITGHVEQEAMVGILRRAIYGVDGVVRVNDHSTWEVSEREARRRVTFVAAVVTSARPRTPARRADHLRLAPSSSGGAAARDPHPGVDHHRAVRAGDHRVAVQLQHLRMRLHQGADPEQHVLHRRGVGLWRTPEAVQQREVGQRAQHLGRVQAGQRRQPDRDVAEQLDHGPAGPARDHRPERWILDHPHQEFDPGAAIRWTRNRSIW